MPTRSKPISSARFRMSADSAAAWERTRGSPAGAGRMGSGTELCIGPNTRISARRAPLAASQPGELTDFDELPHERREQTDGGDDDHDADHVQDQPVAHHAH